VQQVDAFILMPVMSSLSRDPATWSWYSAVGSTSHPTLLLTWPCLREELTNCLQAEVVRQVQSLASGEAPRRHVARRATIVVMPQPTGQD
jgi:hypothetical protein